MSAMQAGLDLFKVMVAEKAGLASSFPLHIFQETFHMFKTSKRLTDLENTVRMLDGNWTLDFKGAYKQRFAIENETNSRLNQLEKKVDLLLEKLGCVVEFVPAVPAKTKLVCKAKGKKG